MADTLTKQLENAHAALTDLQTDEQELQRLLDDQTVEIAKHKEAHARERDFGTLLPLEAKRSALNTLLQEQRQAIEQARSHLAALEAEQARAAQVEQLRGRVDTLQGCRQETDAAMLDLSRAVLEGLKKVNAARTRWHGELTAAQGEVQQVFGLSRLENIGVTTTPADPARQAWQAAFMVLGAGAEAALTQSPLARGYLPAPLRPYERPDRLTPPLVEQNALTFARTTPLTMLLDAPLAALIGQAIARAQRDVPDELLGEANIAYQPLESSEPRHHAQGGSNTNSPDYSL